MIEKEEEKRAIDLCWKEELILWSEWRLRAKTEAEHLKIKESLRQSY